MWDFLCERVTCGAGELGTLPPPDGNGTGMIVRGIGDLRGGNISGIDRELADARDLLSLASPTKGGSGDTNSSETEEESRESDEDSGGIVEP